MISRAIEPLLRRRLRAYPAVVLVGPRQCGKTTLAATLEGEMFDLEQEADRIRLDLSWNQLVSDDRLIILDEAQTWPEVFPRLRGAIDERRDQNGRFLLLGSVAPSLMTQVSESLAGRLSILELTPFLWSELEDRKDRAQHWLYGGFPDGGIREHEKFPQWGIDYLNLLSARDLPNWGLPARPQATDRLLRMMAVLHGQSWNASQIGRSLGISGPTATGYLEYLTGAFLLRRLSPWQANLKKRLVKQPKVFWRDSGLLHALMQTTGHDQLLTQPWVGASWEGYVIEQTIGHLLAQGTIFNPWYFRTSDNYEIDLILEIKGELWAIEIKLTSNPTSRQMHDLNKAASMVDASHRILLSQTSDPTDGEHQASCNLESLLERLPE